jgi:hypothetical protein
LVLVKISRGRRRNLFCDFEEALVKHLIVTGGLLLAAAPGDSMPMITDVPTLTAAAIRRRIDVPMSAIHILAAKPSTRMPGFVVCGTVDRQPADHHQNGAGTERFFVVIPGDFAILDQDGPGLVDTYWSANQCR